jgi:hypothetical protein
MVNSGAWVKVAKQHYRHESGVEIKYRCNDWLWEVVGASEHDGYRWDTLKAARYFVERDA